LSPITHFLASWELACALRTSQRDRALLTWAGLFPDLDGAGLLLDVAALATGHPSAGFYGAYHHFVLHGAFGQLVLLAVCMPLAESRLRTALGLLMVFHLHLLLDLLGSRGPSPDAVWPLYYLGPFSREMVWQWSGQWALNAWPNVLLSLALLAAALRRTVVHGVSPTRLFGNTVDTAFVTTLKGWASRFRR